MWIPPIEPHPADELATWHRTLPSKTTSLISVWKFVGYSYSDCFERNLWTFPASFVLCLASF